MAKRPPGVMIYFDLLQTITIMSMEQRGELFTAILMYAGGYSENPELDGDSKAVWTFLKPRIDEDIAHYAEICEKRAMNGRKGGLAKASNCQPNASKTLQNLANPTQPNTTQPSPTQIGGVPPPASVVSENVFPSLDEVSSFFAALCNPADRPAAADSARNFYDHFTATGWRQKNGALIADWKARARQWWREDAQKRPSQAAAPQTGRGVKMAASYEPDATEIKAAYERLANEQREIS